MMVALNQLNLYRGELCSLCEIEVNVNWMVQLKERLGLPNTTFSSTHGTYLYWACIGDTTTRNVCRSKSGIV